jgi:SAM-dependent methyltransferase
VTGAFESEWRTRFERFARKHADDASVSGWSPTGLEHRLRSFGNMLGALRLPARARALDLGCGAGTYVRLLAGLGHRPIGLDYSLPSLARAAEADPDGAGRYVSGEAYALPVASAAFDLVVCIGVLQALESPERALDEIVRVVKPGGALVVETLNGRGAVARAWHPPRVRTYDPREACRWLEDRGLEVVQVTPLCLPPRAMPGLGRLLGSRPMERALAGSRRLAELAAHTFLFGARKPGAEHPPAG